MAGRRSKLTPERQERLCDALSVGVPRSTACQHAGIGESTFYRWMERGEAGRRGRFREFWEAVQAAETAAEMTAMATWRSAMPTDWRAAKEFLERRFPDKYALAKDTGEGQGPREVYVVREDQLTEEEWDALAKEQMAQAEPLANADS